MTESFRPSLIIQDIRNRLIHYNKNWLAAFIGETGSGKSYGAMHVAEMIDPDFPKDASRVYFSIESMIDDIENESITQGDCVILDETGVSFSNKKWFSQENRNFGWLLQAVRCKNFAIIFCLPSLSFMDKTGRLLMHTIVQTRHVDRMKKVVVAVWKNTRWNDINNTMYYQFPRIKVNGKTVRVNVMHIHKPSEELIKNYEVKKKAFVDNLLTQAKANIKRSKEPKVKRPVGRPRKNPLPAKEGAK
jgi:ABC-type glutathione transport system ATPase component